MLKRLAKSAFAQHAASFLIGLYIRLVYFSSRWELEGLEHYEAAEQHDKGVIVAFWHNRLLMVPMLKRRTERRFFMLVSAHRDGQMMAQSVSQFGIEFIRGSAASASKPGKSKRGVAAVSEMMSALAGQNLVGLTPDGPTGPAEKVKPGVIRLAQLSGAPILPIAYSASRGSRLNTWDRFLMAAPFSKGYYIVGPSIIVPAYADDDAQERLRKELETAIDKITREADERAKRSD
ncbi:lysophospholipid acyltransferase family protein [Hyphococcus flavus]|uniref:Lysophospholipid acyltransferase family protein n=1 Tax=Hyphococcus flavus TaxID=1866326 RepID=A0AAE9ZAM8_9PROT|nr:lysophospholipid acyltransferase family protein [Hyphococcus flavus]WDI30241.1 lysophospholipid acyltransferase family protein [Hyphococcus flavus]